MDLFGWWRRRRCQKELNRLHLGPEERALFEAALARGDKDAATALIAHAQEGVRADFAAKTGIDPRSIVPVIGQQISWAFGEKTMNAPEAPEYFMLMASWLCRQTRE
jgi:hypothetical protein